MQWICLSISHHNAPLDLRECLSPTAEQIEDTLKNAPIREEPYERLREMVILATCNRLEMYAQVAEDENPAADVFQPAWEYLDTALHIPMQSMGAYFQRYQGRDTVEHLFRVAGGLDSIAIGETQILGQVAHALERALRFGSAQHGLSALFRAAVHAGKRVRSETEMGRTPTSLSTLAIQLVEERWGTFAGRHILVVGAGKMGKTTLEALSTSRAAQIVLTNRTYEHTAELAAHFGAVLWPYERLAEGVAEADVVITSTAAPTPILSHALVARALSQRPERPLALVDLAVPRNIETCANQIPGVTLFNMDDLQDFARPISGSRHQEILRAYEILEEEVRAYENLFHITPFLAELHKKAEEVRRREVEKTLRHLPDAGPEVSEQIEILSQSLVRKILHQPTLHLRAETQPDVLNTYLEVLSHLFDLEESLPNAPLKMETHGSSDLANPHLG